MFNLQIEPTLRANCKVEVLLEHLGGIGLSISFYLSEYEPVYAHTCRDLVALALEAILSSYYTQYEIYLSCLKRYRYSWTRE